MWTELGFWLPLLAILLAVPAAASETGFSLQNGYIALKGKGAQVTSVRVDPSGKGRYGANLTTGFGPEEFASTAATRAQVQGDEAVITGLVRSPRTRLEIGGQATPSRLNPGHTLGQSFTITRGSFQRLAASTPTWNATGSGALLRLRREGPEGAVVVERRLHDVADNAEQELTFPPQPAGVYYVELSEPQGSIGWWAEARDSYPGGQAFLDGKPMPDRDHYLRVDVADQSGAAQMRISLDGPRLRLHAEWEQPEGKPLAAPQLLWRTTWTKSGYDVSAHAGVRFQRYFTDNQRYFPVEQIKRRDTAGPSLGPCAWIEADGTTGADLRFSGKDLRLDWSAAEKELTHHFQTADEDKRAVTLNVDVLPRDDALPADWPSFFSADAVLDKDLNRFFYERAFTYPDSSLTPWVEWSALIRAWFAGSLREGERRSVAGLTLGGDGYVYTWGGGRGWPFPDNTKYDTRHFDTNARFILAAWRHYCWTRDDAWLRGQADRLHRAMAYQLGPLQGEKGLLVTNSKDNTGKHGGVGANYWDILPFGHLDAYGNALFHASLLAMDEIERVLGDGPGVDYRALAAQCRRVFDDTFWDPEKGRYIGCVDVDGGRHDYGFTFVNLEALYYGLGDALKARRIYNWMENEPTFSGKADTYIRWVFAPRATTIHNPRWGTGIPTPPAGSAASWWFAGWQGTPWETQCQDGGAILYTSFYDLMDRARYFGADNAWQRFSTILARYREPDRLCGGGPLYRGETPQQENPGAVGTDMPFPESGLVPCYFLYGVLGISADVSGLHIAPKLPNALPKAGVRNLSYRGLPLTITATRDRVRVECRRPGYAFTLEKTLRPGETLTLDTPPVPLTAWPNADESR